MSTLSIMSLVPDLAPQLGDVPPWLPLGWISVESNGRLDDADFTAFPEGELGLFQLDPSERQRLGVDDDRLLLDAPYALGVGLQLIQSYGAQVAAAGIAPRSDLYWYLTKFFHGLGAGGARQVLSAFQSQNGRLPETIDEFRDFGNAEGYVAGHSVAKWIKNADSVRTQGLFLQTLAKLPNPGVTVPVVGLFILGGVAWALRRWLA
jgi:hypothetical protein